MLIEFHRPLQGIEYYSAIRAAFKMFLDLLTNIRGQFPIDVIRKPGQVVFAMAMLIHFPPRLSHAHENTLKSHPVV